MLLDTSTMNVSRAMNEDCPRFTFIQLASIVVTLLLNVITDVTRLVSMASDSITIWRNSTPVGLHVTRRIGLAPITASTSVRQSAAAAVWFAACDEWLANYSNRPSREVRPLIGLHVPGDKVSRMLYLRLMFVSRKLSHYRQCIRRPR